MTDIVVNLPEGLGSINFPADTPKDVIERETATAFLKMRGAKSGAADAKSFDRGLSQAFGGGVLQGAGDEATAFIRSRFPQFSNWMMDPGLKRDASIGGSPEPQTVSTAPTVEGRYEEELARERAKKAEFQKENPVTATAATIAGGAAPFVLGGMVGLPLAPSMGGSLTGNLAKSAVTGAAYGGANAFNEGEGGFDNRLHNAGWGALGGAILAPAFYLGGKGIGAAWDAAKTSPAGQAVLDKVRGGADWLDRLGSVKTNSLSAAAPDSYIPGDNPATYAADQIRTAVPSGEEAIKERAAQFIATAVQRGKMTPEQAQQELQKLGVDATLADVNNSLFRTARTAKTMLGETGDLAEKVMRERATTYNPRLRGSIEGPNANVPEDFYFRGENPPTGNILDQTAREVGKRVYGAMDAAGFKNSPGISKMITENPQVEGAVDRVLSSLEGARQGTDRSPESLVEVMHMVKREIQNIGLDANGRPGSTAYQWQQTANDFVKALKEANPVLAKADVAYAKVKSLPDYYDTGLGVFGKSTTAQSGIEKSAAAVDNMLRVADVMQGNAMEFGAINAGRARTGGNVSDAIGLARTITESDEVKRKVASIFGEERAAQIFRDAETVMRFNRTATGLTGGSQTADKAAEIMTGGIDLGNAGVRFGTSGATPRAFERITDLVRQVAAPNEAVRDEIGRMLINRSAPANQDTLNLVAQILRQRAEAKSAASIVGGVAGAPFGTLYGGSK